ncbi:M42 family metallopeptidase [Proteiniclasticum sp.]|uniref:M42 family metallopeptidase n=1 Tax=Proteiniclasticum sp. TaxID=2053595 RepID=UPI00289F8334|nr:M42 family metallopeptidase [Proteiniclasticum sp.]
MTFEQNITQTLRNLIEINSPTGYHGEVMAYIRKELDNSGIPYEVTVKGAILATISGENKEGRLFSAHVDTLGAMVKRIKGKGSLEFTLIGGYMFNTLESENCLIRTSGNRLISGTIQTTKPSVHIDGGDARTLERIQSNMEIIIDEKVSCEDDVKDLGIRVGDFVFIDPKLKILGNGFIKSRYLDDKASVSILLEAMKTLKDTPLKSTIHFFISNYEEVGHGAKAALPENLVEFIAVDMGAPGNNQNSSEFKVNICAKDSSGPYDYDLRRTLEDLCESENIPYETDIYPFYGSDASAALGAGYDIRTALIGPGVFASHGYERTHMESMKATYDLIVSYAQK